MEFFEGTAKFIIWILAGAVAFGGWTMRYEYRMNAVEDAQTESRSAAKELGNDVKAIKETVIRIDERLKQRSK